MSDGYIVVWNGGELLPLREQHSSALPAPDKDNYKDLSLAHDSKGARKRRKLRDKRLRRSHKAISHA